MKRFFPWFVLALLGCTTIDSPALISPAGGVELTTPNPKFYWHPVLNARSYYIQISADEGFSQTTDTLVYNDTVLYLLDTLELGQSYYWRLFARNSQGVESEPSQVADFFVRSGVELISPGPTDSAAWPEFSWESYSGATGYHFILSRNADFSNPAIDTIITPETLVVEDSLPPFTYYWRVQALYGVIDHSSPSPARKLVTYRLTDTYFPLYTGRTQTYNWVHKEGTYNSFTDEWLVTKTEEKTLLVDVVDSYLEGNRLFWILSDTFLLDIGSEVSAGHDSLFSSLGFMAALYPDGTQPFLSWQNDSFTVEYQGDEMILTYLYGTFAAQSYDSIAVIRRPGAGVIRQVYLTANVPDDEITLWSLDSLELDL